MAANYPTYSTDMGMAGGQQNRVMSNNLRTAGQQTRASTGAMIRREQPPNTWAANRYGMGQQQASQPTMQYSTGQDQARGGGQPTRPLPTYTPSPLPGQGPVDREGGGMDYYNPTMPTYTPSAQPGQVQANTFSYYPGLDPATLQSNDEREAALQAVQANVPVWQLNQNAYQYSQDANEANRRWQEQFNYQQGLDTYNMGLAGRQQQMSEWQAQQAAQQWAQDYNRNQANDQWQQGFSQQQFGLQDYATREGLAQQAAAQQWQQQYQGGQLAQGNRQLDIQQQLGQGNLDIQRQAGEVDRLYRMGQLDLGQRNAALAELTQSQQSAYQQLVLAQQQQEQGRRFGLDERTQAEMTAYRQQQLAQEAAIAREQMAAQREMALMQAYGRNQAPNARWMRSA